MSIVSEVTGLGLFVNNQLYASVRGAAAIGRAAAKTGAFDAWRLPAPLETTRIEAESPAWIEHYYSRFKSSYEALFGSHEYIQESMERYALFQPSQRVPSHLSRT